jgi:hypothetical protein
LNNLLGGKTGSLFTETKGDHTVKVSLGLTTAVLAEVSKQHPGFRVSKKVAVETALFEFLQRVRDKH